MAAAKHFKPYEHADPPSGDRACGASGDDCESIPTSVLLRPLLFGAALLRDVGRRCKTSCYARVSLPMPARSIPLHTEPRSLRVRANGAAMQAPPTYMLPAHCPSEPHGGCSSLKPRCFSSLGRWNSDAAMSSLLLFSREVASMHHAPIEQYLKQSVGVGMITQYLDMIRKVTCLK